MWACARPKKLWPAHAPKWCSEGATSAAASAVGRGRAGGRRARPGGGTCASVGARFLPPLSVSWGSSRGSLGQRLSHVLLLLLHHRQRLRPAPRWVFFATATFLPRRFLPSPSVIFGASVFFGAWLSKGLKAKKRASETDQGLLSGEWWRRVAAIW